MADANITTDPHARTSRPVFRGRRRSSRPLAGDATSGRIAPLELLAVAALIAVATAVYTVYALRVGQFQNDEEQYLSLARYVAAHFPGALWQSGIYPRGPQRLDAWIMAIPFAFERGPAAFQIAHALQCLMFASTALPVFLLARRTGLSAVWSVFAAALAIVVPWAVVATSFLAESAAYPAFAWVLYATWMALLRPSPSREALVLVAVFLAVLSRTAMFALVPLMPLAVLWQQWRWGDPDTPRVDRLRRLPGRLARRHPISAAMIALGALVLLADALGLLPGRGLGALAGGYGLPHLETFSATLSRFRQYLARAAVGTGFLALVLALTWTLGTLVWPRERRRHATAVVCTLAACAVLLSLLEAGADERYIVYLAVPISLAAAAGLSSAASSRIGRRGWATLVAATAIVIALITSADWPPLASPYDFFSYPSAMFYQRVLLIHLGKVHVLGAEALVAAAIVVVVVAFAAAIASRRLGRPAAGALGAALLALCLTQDLYAMKKFTGVAGAGGPTADQRSWVDRIVPSGTKVGALALSMGAGPSYLPIWRDTEFWNTSVKVDAYFESVGALPLPLGSEPVQLTIAPESGLLLAHNGAASGPRRAVPRYLLVPEQGTNSIGLHGTVVATGTYLPLTLMRLASPARVDWQTVGASEEGFMAPNAPLTATVYNRAAREIPDSCATFSLIAPPNFPGRWPFTVTRNRRVVLRGTLAAQQQLSLAVKLDDASGPSTKLVVKVHGSVAFATGAVVSARLAFFAIARCPAHHG